MQPPHLQRSNASKGIRGMPPVSAAKATTSAAEARKVALLCGHHLDRLRVLAFNPIFIKSSANPPRIYMPRRLLLSLSRIEWPAWNVQNWILKVR
jgi:hypothetical protein